METIRQHIYTRGITGFGTVATSNDLSQETIISLEKLEGCAATSSNSESFLWTTLGNEYVFTRSEWKPHGNGLNDTRPHPFIHTYLIPASIAHQILSDPHSFFCQTMFENRYTTDLQVIPLFDCPIANSPRHTERQWSFSFLCMLAKRLLNGKTTVVPLRGDPATVNTDALDLMARAHQAIPHSLVSAIPFFTMLSKQTKLPYEIGLTKPMVYFTRNIPDNELYNLAYKRYEAELLDPSSELNANFDALVIHIAAAMYEDRPLNNEDIELIDKAFEDKLDSTEIGLILSIIEKLRSQKDISDLSELINEADEHIGPDWEGRYLTKGACLVLKNYFDARQFNNWSLQNTDAEKTADIFITHLIDMIDWGSGYLSEQKAAEMLEYKNEHLLLQYRRFALEESPDERNVILQSIFTEGFLNMHKGNALKVYERIISEGVERLESIDKVSLAQFITHFLHLFSETPTAVQALKKVFLSLTEYEKSQLINNGNTCLVAPILRLYSEELRPSININRDNSREDILPQWFIGLDDKTMLFMVDEGICNYCNLPKDRLRNPQTRKTMLSMIKSDTKRSSAYDAILQLMVIDSQFEMQVRYLADILTDVFSQQKAYINQEISRLETRGIRTFGAKWGSIFNEAIRDNKDIAVRYAQYRGKSLPPTAPILLASEQVCVVNSSAELSEQKPKEQPLIVSPNKREGCGYVEQEKEKTDVMQKEMQLEDYNFMVKLCEKYPETKDGRKRLYKDIQTTLNGIKIGVVNKNDFIFCLAASLSTNPIGIEEFCTYAYCNLASLNSCFQKGIQMALRIKMKELKRKHMEERLRHIIGFLPVFIIVAFFAILVILLYMYK